jgi:ATP-binding cassette subfamily C protein CydCD
MSILRVTFLSSLALELLASLSVALVAVSVGLRLAEGQIQYAAALFVLLLAPEAYLPLRLVGQHYHAAAEGLGAAQRIFELLERTSTPLEAAAPTGIAVHEASVVYGERSGLSPTTFTAHPGTVTALMGPSGGGKSTLLALLLGELAPTGGTVTAIDPAHVAYVPQHAHLVDADLDASPTIEQVLRLGAPEATDEQLREVLTRVHLDAGLLTRRVHEATTGVSAGQAQRLAVARALLRRAPVVLMDEPTAALDGQSEEPVIAAVRAEADRGAIVIVAAHRPSLLAIADQVVVVANARDTEQRVPAPLGVAKEILGAGW